MAHRIATYRTAGANTADAGAAADVRFQPLLLLLLVGEVCSTKLHYDYCNDHGKSVQGRNIR